MSEAPAAILAPRPAFHPALALHVSFFGLVAGVILLTGDRLPHRAALLALNLSAVAGTIGVAVLLRRLPTAHAAMLRVAWSVILIPLAFTQLGWIIPSLRPHSAENLLIRVDQWIFGVNPTQWAERFHDPWLTEILQWMYASFYFIPLVLAARLIAARKWLELDVALVAVILGFYSSYAGYFLVPAQSPDKILPYSSPLHGVWATDAIRATLARLENIVYDCFPSGHTEVSLLVLWFAWRFDRIAFGVLAVPVTLLVASTIYLRYHYGIDLVMGLVFAIGVILVLRPIERGLRRSSQA